MNITTIRPSVISTDLIEEFVLYETMTREDTLYKDESLQYGPSDSDRHPYHMDIPVSMLKRGNRDDKSYS